MPWNYFCLGVFSELGDRTFLATVMLAVWCPFRGVRSSEWRCLQQLLVMSGSGSALALRTGLVFIGYNTWRWDMRCEIFAAMCCALLGVKALFDLRHAVAAPSSKCTSHVPPPCTVQIPTGGSLSGVKMYDPEATEEPACSAGGVAAIGNSQRGERPSESGSDDKQPLSSTSTKKQQPYGSMPSLVTAGSRAATVAARDVASGYFSSFVFAFAVPFSLVSITEAEDKSQGAFLIMTTKPDVTLHVLAGMAVATALATLCGVVLERSLRDQRLLYTLVVAFAFMSLTTISQALVHLQAVSP